MLQTLAIHYHHLLTRVPVGCLALISIAKLGLVYFIYHYQYISLNIHVGYKINRQHVEGTVPDYAIVQPPSSQFLSLSALPGVLFRSGAYFFLLGRAYSRLSFVKRRNARFS